MADISCVLTRFYVYIFFSFFIFVFFLLSALLCLSVLLKSQAKLMEVREKDPKTNYLLNLEKRIREGNEILEEIKKKHEESTIWTPVFEELSKVTPSGIHLTRISYNLESGRVDLKGWSDTRERVILMQESLEKSEYCHDVSSPLSNLLKQTDINFNFTFKPKQ